MPTLVCTGCSSGLGYEALKLFVQQSPLTWRIFVGSRSPSRGQQVVQELAAMAPTAAHQIVALLLDLALLSSVKNFATELEEHLSAGTEHRGIDVVLLSAGVYKAETVMRAGGWSEEAVVNHFAQHYLLQLLQPLLNPPAPSHVLPRIIFVSSTLQNNVKSLDVTPALRGEHGTAMDRYKASKLVQMIGAHGWKKVLAGQADVVAVSPGFVPTSGLNRESFFLQRIFLHHILSWAPFCTSLHDGASSILRLLFPPPDVMELIEQHRSQTAVLYLGVRGERQEPSALISTRKGADAKKLLVEWCVDRGLMEKWMMEEVSGAFVED